MVLVFLAVSVITPFNITPLAGLIVSTSFRTSRPMLGMPSSYSFPALLDINVAPKRGTVTCAGCYK